LPVQCVDRLLEFGNRTLHLDVGRPEVARP